MFLEDYGSQGLPWVWAGVGLAAVLAVAAYSRIAANRPLPEALRLVGFASAGTLGALLALRALGVPHASALIYVWKDVHVVLLLEILWSFANVTFDVRTARRAYGVFCACGSIGGIAGAELTGAIAQSAGTDVALLAPLPVLVGIAWFGGMIASDAAVKVKKRTSEGALRALLSSRYLLLMLALVLLAQISITLVDYSYNEIVERSFTDADERTRMIGHVYAAIDVTALVLQIATAPILRGLGVPMTLLAIPLLLGGAVTAAALVPRFLTLALTKVIAKSMDYSLFRAAKEILYIPLSYEEKTRGKAMIDMLTYRVAKVGASLLLGGFVLTGRGDVVAWLVLGLAAIWLVVAWRVTRRYRARVSREEEIEGSEASDVGIADDAGDSPA